MSFKDLQFNIGKLTSKVKSQVARNNPLQDHDSKGLNLWLFEERNHLAMAKTAAYQQNETNRAFLEWIQEDLMKNQQHENYSQDVEAVGSALYDLLCKQVELENEYNERHILYRRAIKSMRDKEKELCEAREKKKSTQERIEHLNKTNPTSNKIQDLDQELQDLNLEAKEAESIEFKRFILKEGFYLRFNALQEYSEKMAILAGYGKYITDLLDADHHASSNCDMILKDAFLSIDNWKPKDKRETVTEEDLLLEHQDDEAHDDAVLLTDKQIKKGHESIKIDNYYHGLYRRMSEQANLPIHPQTHRPYQEFQYQFHVPPPPAYSSSEKP